LGPMAVNSTATVTLGVTPQPAESLSDTATVGSDFVDPLPANNTATLITPMLPRLAIRQPALNLLSVSWLTNFSSFNLQFKNALSTNAYWSNAITAKVISNTNYVVTEGATNITRYYRLKK
jgi:hypothetical protein